MNEFPFKRILCNAIVSVSQDENFSNFGQLWSYVNPYQGHRKVSDIGEAPIKSVPKFPENIRVAQLLVAQNIGGARAPVPPLFLRPWVLELSPE